MATLDPQQIERALWSATLSFNVATPSHERGAIVFLRSDMICVTDSVGPLNGDMLRKISDIE
jgi:hypothetical protein